VKIYMIRHKPTGQLMPKVNGITFYDVKDWKGPPRVFFKLGDAKGLLTVYCRGALERQFADTEDYQEYFGLYHNPKTARDKTEFEILTFNCTEEQ